MSPSHVWDGPGAAMPPATDPLVLPAGEWELVRSLHEVLRNVSAPAYASPMGTFPVDPADVPPEAVSVMKHTLLRHADAIAADPLDEETARTITWVLMNWLARDNHKTPGGRDDTRSRA